MASRNGDGSKVVAPNGESTYDQMGVGDPLTTWVRQNYDTAILFPRSGFWTKASLPDNAQVEYQKASEVGFIEPVDDLFVEDYESTIKVWHVTKAAERRLDELGDNRLMKMPCGHTGFTNERDSDFLTCRHCGGRFTREEVQ